MAGYRIPGSLDGTQAKGARIRNADGFNLPSASYSKPGAVSEAELTPEQKELLLDLGQLVLDIVGFFEPTPFADGTNSLISLGRGDLFGAGISLLGVIPYIGDLAKAGKLPRYASSLSKAITLARHDVNFARRLRPVLQKLANILEDIPLSGLPNELASQLKQLKNRIKGFLVPASKQVWNVKKIQEVAKHITINLGNRPVALYFGLGSGAEKLIPKKYASIGRLLEETVGGQALLKHLNDWKAGGKEGWEILSRRLAEIAGEKGGMVHVFVNKQFQERWFPNPLKLQEWWKGHKVELLEIKAKELFSKAKKGNETMDQISKALQPYKESLERWTKSEIEAQHYAIKSKNKFSGNYEDEVFHKIERLHLSKVEYHVMDNGQEIDKFLDLPRWD